MLKRKLRCHLDIVSKEILKDALESYTGTLVIVSHDRDFLDGLTDKVFYINNRELKVYYEGLSQFLKSYYSDENTFASKKQNPNKSDSKDGVNIKKLSNRLKTIERKIESLEADLAKVQENIYQDASDENELQKKIEQVKKLKKDIEKKYEEWAEVSQLIEQ